MVNPEVQKVLEILDQSIGYLRIIRKAMATEFGLEESMWKPNTPSQPGTRSRCRAVKVEKKTNSIVVAEYLRIHGPSRRKDIIAATGLTAGAVDWALCHASRFVRKPDGWMNVNPGQGKTTRVTMSR